MNRVVVGRGEKWNLRLIIASEKEIFERGHKNPRSWGKEVQSALPGVREEENVNPSSKKKISTLVFE